MSATLNQILYAALVAKNDIETMTNITGLRKKLKTAGIDPSKINIFKTEPAPRSDDMISAMLLVGKYRDMAETANKKVASLEAKVTTLEEEANSRSTDDMEDWDFAYIEFLDRLAVFGRCPSTIWFNSMDYTFDTGPMIDKAIHYGLIVEENDMIELTVAGVEFLAQQPRAWRIENGGSRPPLRNLTVTEYVTKMAYTPVEAEAEKRRIDIARHAGKITIMAASKHKAWVSRRTTKEK
jgi:hypothetical protein